MTLHCNLPLARSMAAGLAFVVTASVGADPGAVLQAARDATGGAAWDGIRSLHVHANLQASGRAGVSDRYEDVASGRFVRESRLPPRGEGADGYDGQSVWVQPANAMAYVLGDEDARLGAVNDSFRVARAWWFPGRRPATVEDGGTRREGGRDFDRVRMTPEGGRPFVVWIDRETHLPDRVVEQAAEQVNVIRYADYRWVGGVRLPFDVRTGDGDAAYDEIEDVERIEVNVDIADRRFSLPPLPAAGAAGEAVTLPFRLEDNRILVQVAIDGHGPYDAEFDTGGSLIVPPAVVSALKLAPVGQGKETGGGEGFVTTRRGVLDTLSLGAAVVPAPAYSAFAWNGRHPQRLLIGLETLQRFVVQLDFDRLEMTLTPPTAFHPSGAGQELPFHFQDNQPEILGAVDGIAATMAVDTGDDGSLLLIAPFARRHGLAERYHATIPYAGSSVGATGGLMARVGEVSLAGPDGRPLVRVERPITRISTQKSGFDANRYVSANLGMGILKQFNLTFDYARQRITLARNHLYGLADPYNRSGLQLQADGTGWKVTLVVAGGPGEKAGIRLGDHVATIGARPRAQLDGSAVRQLFLAPVGTPVELDIVRDGAESTCTLALADVL